MLNEFGSERGLAGAGRTGDADAVGVAEAGMERVEQRLEARTAVLDERDDARERRAVAGGEALQQLGVLGGGLVRTIGHGPGKLGVGLGLGLGLMAMLYHGRSSACS